MKKMKVFELAKKLGISNSELIAKLKKMNVEVKSHLSVLEDSVVEKMEKENKVKKDDKKTADNKTNQMHIIRRNVKVINTNGEKSEVEQITTDISGTIKKSHHTLVDENKLKKGYSREGLGIVTPRSNYNNRKK